MHETAWFYLRRIACTMWSSIEQVIPGLPDVIFLDLCMRNDSTSNCSEWVWTPMSWRAGIVLRTWRGASLPACRPCELAPKQQGRAINCACQPSKLSPHEILKIYCRQHGRVELQSSTQSNDSPPQIRPGLSQINRDVRAKPQIDVAMSFRGTPRGRGGFGGRGGGTSQASNEEDVPFARDHI